MSSLGASAVQNSKDPGWQQGALEIIRGMIYLMLEDALDNWYADCPKYAEEVIYPVLCQVRTEEWDDELADGTKIVSINTSI